MIKKIGSLKILALFAFLNFIADAKALDIPSYIEDPQDVTGNIEIIVEENTPIVKNSEDAESWELKTQEMLRQYASQLYADALSIRAGMIGSSSPEDSSSLLDGVNIPGKAGETVNAVKSIFSKLSALSQDNTAILQNEVKDYNKNIALRLKQIATLEAAIGNLQGFWVINSFNSNFSSSNEEED